MNICDRIAKALTEKSKRRNRFGFAPLQFILNVHHWHKLAWCLEKTGTIMPREWWIGKPFDFLGTKLILRNTSNVLRDEI